MDIRNRLSSVDRIRCKALQDFFAMTVQPGWKEKLYECARHSISNKEKYCANYRPIYEIMRDKGVDQFIVGDMDATTIIMVVNFHRDIIPISEGTRKEINKLREDRNQSSPHLNEHEADEELYLRAILALYNLKGFVRCVDENEECIDESLRWEYRKKYIKEIEELKNVLDEERFKLIRIDKDVEETLNKIKESYKFEEPYSEENGRLWFRFSSAYWERRQSDIHDETYNHLMNTFHRRASDLGIVQSHEWAAHNSAFMGDAEDLEKRLRFMLDCPERDCSKSIINIINDYLVYPYAERPLTKGLEKIIDMVSAKGHRVCRKEMTYNKKTTLTLYLDD